MEQNGDDESGDCEVQSPVAGWDGHFPKAVTILFVGGFERDADAVKRARGEEERQALDDVVEPVAGFVVGEVALVADDGCEAEEEDEAVELQGFGGYAGGALAFEGFEVEDSEAEHSGHGAVCHEEGEVSAG